MRVAGIRGGLTAGVSLLAMALLAPAQAQTAPLRGSQDAQPEEQPLRVQGETQGKIKPDPPPITLRKPANVTRIRTPPAPALRDVTPDPNAPVPAVSPGDDGASAPIGPPTLDAEPAPPRRKRPPEDDPYAPLGYRAGAFLLKPSIEVDFGYDDNPGRQTGKVKGATYVLVTPKLDFQTDWPQHELRGSIEGGYTHYFGQSDEDRPTLKATLDGRLDVRRDTAITAEARLDLETQRIGDVGVPTGTTKRPLTLAYGGSLGLTQTFGRADFSLKGNVDRNQYEADPDSDYNTYGATLRGTYELSPAIKPFVEVTPDTRVHDTDEPRDSNGISAKAGVGLDIGGTLTGEASLGYGVRHYNDPALPNLDGVLVNASLVWAVTPLTTITLTGSTELAETTLEEDTNPSPAIVSLRKASGSVNRTAGIEIAHALRRNVTLTAAASATSADYVGVSRTDTTIDASLGVEYKLSRTVSVKGTYAFERLLSTADGQDYTANSISAGLKLQF